MCICHLNMHSKHVSVIWTCTHPCTVNIYLSLEYAHTHPSTVNYVSVTWTCTANIYIRLLNIHNYPCTVKKFHLKLLNTDCDQGKEQKHWSKLLNTVIRGEDRSTDQSCWTLTVISRRENRSTDQSCWTLTVIRGQEYWSKLLNTDWSEERTGVLIKAVQHCDQITETMIKTVEHCDCDQRRGISTDQSCWTLWLWSKLLNTSCDQLCNWLPAFRLIAACGGWAYSAV